MSVTLTLDKAGRIALPKSLRDRLHLRAGSKLRAEIVGNRIELRGEWAEGRIEMAADGLPVICGWEGFNSAKAAGQLREDQVR